MEDGAPAFVSRESTRKRLQALSILLYLSSLVSLLAAMVCAVTVVCMCANRGGGWRGCPYML